MKLFITHIFYIGLWVCVAVGQSNNRNTDEWYKEEWPPQPYEFGYEVRDNNGNEQYRKEMSDGQRVTGSYGYMGPDGVFRRVEYTADENGFRAKIKTSEPGTANENPADVEIESNPVRVPQNPTQASGSVISPGVDYDSFNPTIIPVQPVGGIRGDQYTPTDRTSFRDSPNRNTFDDNFRDDINRDILRDNQNRNTFDNDQNRNSYFENPNRSTYGNRPPVRSSIPRIPDPSSLSDPSLSLNRDIQNINRGSEVAVGRNPNINRIDSININRDRSSFGDRPGNQLPDNIVPYSGAIPKRPIVGSRVGSQNEFDDRSFGSNFRGIQDADKSRDRVRPTLPIIPPQQPFDRNYGRTDDRNVPIRGSVFDENKGSTIGSSDGPKREFDARKGGPKRPSTFIEATKGLRDKPIRDFAGVKGRPSLFDEDRDDNYDGFRRRQEDRKTITDDPSLRRIRPTNRTTFEDRDSPQREVDINRSRFDTSINDGTKGQSNRGSPLFNRSSFDVNQDKQDIDRDSRVRRPTKVFVTNGPIFMTDDKRIQSDVKDDRSYGPEQQHIDFDDKSLKDDRSEKDSYDQRFGGPKRPDSSRPQRPIQREQKPDREQDGRPYFAGRDINQGGRNAVILMTKDFPLPREILPQPRPQAIPQRPQTTYRPTVEQKRIQEDKEDFPVQRDDEFPVEQPLRPERPREYRPSRPDRPQVSQPTRPQTPSSYDFDAQQRDRQSPDFQQRSEYKPRTRFNQSYEDRDRTYIEQKHIEIQPFQTQNSPTISKAVQTIQTFYEPQDLPLSPEATEKDVKEKPLKEPLSSSYIVTPFTEAVPEVSLNTNTNLSLHKFSPAINQIQKENFGSRIQTESPLKTSYESRIETNEEEKVKNLFDDHRRKEMFDDADDDQFYVDYDENHNQNIETKENGPKKLSYSQSISQSSTENVAINANTSSPIQISHKGMSFTNWQKYDHIDNSQWK